MSSKPAELFTGKRSGTLSLHCPERKVVAARLPASRVAFLCNAHDIQSSDQTPLATLGLERTRLRHAHGGPTGSPVITPSCSRLGYRWPLHHPAVRKGSSSVIYTPLFLLCQTIWENSTARSCSNCLYLLPIFFVFLSCVFCSVSFFDP